MNMARLNTIWVLAKRELRSTLFGAGIYLAVLISLIVSSAVLQNYLIAIGRDQILVTTSPLSYPLFFATCVCAVYLAVASVTSIAREKDRQTLEVLYYGPVSHTTYILGKYLKGMLSFTFILLFLTVFFVFASVMSNFGLSIRFPGVLLLSFFLSSCVIAFGIVISALSRSVRTAVLAFSGIVIGLVAVHVTHAMLIKLNAENLSPLLVYLGNTLSIVNAVVKWISPFHYLSEGMEAVRIGSAGQYAVSAILSMLYSIGALVLSIFVFAKKGVRYSGGG